MEYVFFRVLIFSRVTLCVYVCVSVSVGIEQNTQTYVCFNQIIRDGLLSASLPSLLLLFPFWNQFIRDMRYQFPENYQPPNVDM